MADTNQKEVIIEIKTKMSDSLDSIERLKKELEQLTVEQIRLNGALKNAEADFKAGKISEDEYTKTTKALSDELEVINSQMKVNRQQMNGYRKDIENEIKDHEAAEGSIKQMRIELSKMRKEYESMSKTDRESDAGQALLGKIAGTTEELKKLEQAQGDWRREVGHYQNALENLSPILSRTIGAFKAASGGTMNFNVALKNAGTAVKTFGKQLLKLAVNPVVLAIVAVVTVVKKLVDQFKQTDDAMTALEQLFASFSPILEVFRGILSVIVGILTKVIGGLTSMVTAVMSLVPAFGEASKAAQDYVKAMDQLEETERRYTVQTAKNEVEIARLKNKVAQADKYSVDERREALKEAMELEKQNLEMEKEVALEKLRLAEQDAARRNDTSDETKNTIAQLEAAYYQAIANTEAGMRRLYSQMAKFNEDIRKESINTWKSIIGNSAFSTAEWKEADKEYDKRVKAMEAKAAAYAKMAADEAAAGGDTTELEAKAKQYRKEADDERRTQRSEHKKYLDALKSLSESYYNNELNARRAYEDAVLSMMDDTLEKELKAVELEYDREIEDLRHKLKTEEHLTVKAREDIEKTIEEKEKMRNRKRILTEAAYWSEVRKTAKEALEGISDMVAEFVSSDPNRIIGAFSETVKQTFRSVSKGLEEEYKKINEGFKADINGLMAIAKRFTNYPMEGVAQAMQVLADSNSEFMKNASKSVIDFVKSLDELRKTAKLTSKDYGEILKLLFPYLKNIQEYYKTMLTLPEQYISSTTNKIITMMSQKAGEVKESIMKGLEYTSISESAVSEIEKIVNMVDNALGKGFKYDPILERLIGDYDAIRDEIYRNPIEINWTLAAKKTISYEEKAMLMELANKYGNEISHSFSDILENISGFQLLENQIWYVVTHYEEAVEKIQQFNKDMQAAFVTTGEQMFKDAMIDESVVLPQLRRIYEYALNNNKMRVNWEQERLKVEGRYVGEADRELKVQLDLLKIEKQKAVIAKSNAQMQRAYLQSNRDYIANLEFAYNKIYAENTTRIRQMEEELMRLREEKASFDENTTEEDVAVNAARIATYERDIERMRKEIADALKALSNTGFMSVDEVDKTIEQLTTTILKADNTIVSNTESTTQTVTQLWLTSFTRVTGGLGQISSAFNSMFSEMGEINERWNAFAEATAYMTIGLNMAEGIAEAVAAGSGVPWPANLAAIASGIAAVIAGIGSAFSTYNQYHSQPKFAQGGYVSGEKGVDKIPAWLSDGEYVIRRQRVKELGVQFLDELNGCKSVPGRSHFATGGVVSSDNMAKTINSQMQMETMKEMLSEVMGEIQPVVSVREISNVQNKVKAKESIARK